MVFYPHPGDGWLPFAQHEPGPTTGELGIHTIEMHNGRPRLFLLPDCFPSLTQGKVQEKLCLSANVMGFYCGTWHQKASDFDSLGRAMLRLNDGFLFDSLCSHCNNLFKITDI